MAVDVTTEIVIERSPERVAAYADNPDNAPAWYVNIESVEWRTEPPLAVGTRCAFVARFLGRRLAYVYEVVEYDPARRLTMRTVDGPFPMETVYTYRPLDSGNTRVELRNRGTPSGFSTLAAPFMRVAMRRANNKDLASLKRIVEALPAD